MTDQNDCVKLRRIRRYVGRVVKPADGWTAYFVELTYDSGGSFPFKFTTEVAVTPNVLPFRWEDAAKRYPKIGAPAH